MAISGCRERCTPHDPALLLPFSPNTVYGCIRHTSHGYKEEQSVRLVGYTRTSSNGNGGSEDSLAAQADACREWAESKGHELVALHSDGGLSGGLPVDQRPELMRALLDIEQGRADGLVVHRLDRLARELHVQEAALAQVWTAGGSTWEAYTGQEVLQDDPADPMRTAMRQVTGVFTQLERGMIRLRMQGGRKRKAERGGYVGGQQLHRKYGFRLAEQPNGRRDYDPVPEEQAVIRLIRKLRRNATYRAVAEHLNAAKVPPPSGKAWYAQTVRRIERRLVG